uniref:RNA replication protein n=2 Tax=Opuntia virus X TaxID=253702 RepID=A0A173G3F2_9VIRU|nr:RdRp polymerase [Opuntia virus X]ATU47236.1 replicase [Opuntia virus X]
MARVREVYSSFSDPSLKAIIQDEAYKAIQTQMRQATVVNPYALSTDAADALENLGIITNPYSIQPHTHAAAKAIENDLYNTVAYHLPKEPVTFYYMKPGKLGKFRRGPQHKDRFINSLFEPKDIARYPEETVVKHLEESPCSTSNAFMGDTLHFFKPEQLMTLFRLSPRLKTLYATLVLPAEAMHELPSLHPHIYSLKYTKNHFIYMPGGHAGASYVHSREQLAWLLIGKLTQGDMQLTFQLLESKGANHLFIIQRMNMQTPPLRTFGVGAPYVLLPKIFLPSEHNMQQPIPTAFATKMFLYCKSLKEVSTRDLYAKVRQLLAEKDLEKYSPRQMVHMINYFFLIGKLDSVTCFESTLTGSALRQFFKPLIVWWQYFKQKITGDHEFVQLLKALEWRKIDLTYNVTECNTNQWWQLLRGKEPTIATDNEAFSDFWDPNSYNPLDKVDELSTEQLKAWDFLQKQRNPTQEEFHKDPLETPTEGLEQHDSITHEFAQADVSPQTDQDSARNELKQEESSADTATTSVADTPETSAGAPQGTERTRGPIVNAHGVIIEKFDCDKDPEHSWTDFLLFNLRKVDKVGKRWVTLYSKRPEIKSYSYGNITHSAQAWPEALTAVCQNFSVDDSFDHCLFQVFEASASIGLHQDDEALIAPDTEIVTLNFGSADLTTLDIKTGSKCFTPLNGTVKYSMPPGFQKTHKHAVKSNSAKRISITFRKSVHCTEDLALPWIKWLPILKGAGFQGNKRQINPNDGSLILPIMSIQKLPTLECSIPSLNQTLKQIHRLPTPFLPDPLRAKSFGSDVKNLRVGALLKHQSKEWLDTFGRKTEIEPRQVALSVIHGVGGSGKSHAIQEWIRLNPEEKIVVILPTNELRLDWTRKIPKAPVYMFKTFEKALLQPAPSVVVIDDYTKIPAGFIEAYIVTNPSLHTLIITGDSRQSFHHETNEQALTAKLAPFSEIAQQYCRYYLNATHRNKQDLANMLGVYSEVAGTTSITMSPTVIPDRHLLVPSLYKKMAYSEMGHKVSTYAGCQGLTAPSVQILIDNDTPMCSQQVMYTALSRAVHAIHFINTGVDNDAFWTKLAATPYLAAFLRLVREEALKESKVEEPQPQADPNPPTHFPVENETTFFDHIVDNMTDKHSREIFSQSTGFSNCVQTEDPVVQMFPHQQAKDETLFWATVEARLKITSPEKNFTEFISKKHLGDVLFENYKLAMGLPKEPIAFDQKLWEVCADEVQKTYLSKPINMIQNGQNRQSPDFDPKAISLFLKSQWVKKVEKLGQPRIKAGQTIASFQQEAVMLYGTMARYMRRVREVFQPANIFINCERTPEDMDRWAREHWNFNRLSYANDYTAFDQSQDGAMLQFEVLKARHHCIPEEFIEGYIDLKCSSKTFLGILKIMRLTGEGPTFDANTECNIAFAHTMLRIPKNAAQLYAGDDCAFDISPDQKPSFKKIETEISLKAKPSFKRQIKGEWAEFCGMLITPLGVVKDPIKTWAALQLAKRLGQMKDVRDSYERDVCLAYQHKDKLHEIFSEEQSKAHQLTVREIIRHKGGTVFSTYD